VQGGLDPELRQESAEGLRSLGFPGYAVGGLSVGEGPEAMVAALQATTPHLPADRPRYLMGVGQPEDIMAAVAAGIDMFDCVLPTRCGRNSLVYTFAGQVRLRNARHATDERPLEEGCPCVACRHGPDPTGDGTGRCCKARRSKASHHASVRAHAGIAQVLG
jgi:queuine tRNA-ribosyltransferase